MNEWIASNDPNSMFVDTNYSNPQFKKQDHTFKTSKMAQSHKRVISPTMYWEQGVFNQRNPIFNDKKIRKAIAHSINWGGIAEIAGKENILTTSTFEPPFSRFYKPNPEFIYSRKLAAQLIKSAGWTKSKASDVYLKGDKKLEFNMVVLKDNPQRVKIAKLIAKNLNEAGFKVSLYPKSKSFLMKRVIKEGRFTGLALYGIKMDLNRAPRTLFHSSEIPSSRNNYLGQNVGFWYSKDLDNSLDNLRLSISGPKREKYFNQIQNHYSKDIPGISLFYHNDFVLIPLNVQIEKAPLGKAVLSTLPRWKIVK
jgi:peptide/nickel transport system substrate-binding protein